MDGTTVKTNDNVYSNGTNYENENNGNFIKFKCLNYLKNYIRNIWSCTRC